MARVASGLPFELDEGSSDSGEEISVRFGRRLTADVAAMFDDTETLTLHVHPAQHWRSDTGRHALLKLH